MSNPIVYYLPEEQLIQKALEALMTALGPAEATRFLSLTQMGRIESVVRHQKWQDTLDKSVLFDQLFNETPAHDRNEV